MNRFITQTFESIGDEEPDPIKARSPNRVATHNNPSGD